MSTKQKLIQARKAIREKLRLLRLGQLKQDSMLRETFKPVTDSIKQISTNINNRADGDGEDDDNGVTEFFNSHSESRIDKTYGVTRVRPYMLGTKPVTLTKNTIRIGDKEFQRTQGLLNLIFLKSTRTSNYLPADLDAYREIMLLTDLHKDVDGNPKSVTSMKYKNVIKHILDKKSSTGDGIDIQHKSLSDQAPEYIYYSRPDDLVDRLRLLMASAAAGNTAHSNEVVSIISQLRERGIIE